jgi:hypothetical protein
MSPLQLCEKVKEHDARLAKLEAAAKLRERTPFSGHIYADDVAAAAENYAPAEPRTDDAVEMIRKELPPFIANPIIAAIEAEREKHKADGQAARDSYGRLRQSLWNEQHSHGMTKDALAAEKRAHGLTQQKWDRAIGECERLREERNKYHRLLNEAAQATGVKNIILDRTPDAIRDVIATLRAKLAEAERERDSLREIAKVTERAFIDGVNAGAEATLGLCAQSNEGQLRERVNNIIQYWGIDAHQNADRRALLKIERVLAEVPNEEDTTAHPSASPSAEGAGDKFEESGLARYGYVDVFVGSNEFRMLPNTAVRIGAHTMSVAEWAGLAAKLENCHREIERLGVDRLALQARIDKAAGMIASWKERHDYQFHAGFTGLPVDSLLFALTATDADTATIPGVENA